MMDVLEEVIAVLEEKREELLARMEKGHSMIQNEKDAVRRVKLQTRYDALERSYGLLILALGVLRLDYE